MRALKVAPTAYPRILSLAAAGVDMNCAHIVRIDPSTPHTATFQHMGPRAFLSDPAPPGTPVLDMGLGDQAAFGLQSATMAARGDGPVLRYCVHRKGDLRCGYLVLTVALRNLPFDGAAYVLVAIGVDVALIVPDDGSDLSSALVRQVEAVQAVARRAGAFDGRPGAGAPRLPVVPFSQARGNIVNLPMMGHQVTDRASPMILHHQMRVLAAEQDRPVHTLVEEAYALLLAKYGRFAQRR